RHGSGSRVSPLLVDAALDSVEGEAGAGAVTHLGHFGEDGDRHLLGGLGADVETDRRVDGADLVLGEAKVCEALDAEVVGPPASHGPDVAGTALEGCLEGGGLVPQIGRAHV